MILDIIFHLLAVLMNLFSAIFQGIGFVLPTFLITGIHTAFGYLNYVGGLFPLHADSTRSGLWHDVGLLNIFVLMVEALVLMYLVKLCLWIYGFMPWSKHEHRLPRH